MQPVIIISTELSVNWAKYVAYGSADIKQLRCRSCSYAMYSSSAYPVVAGHLHTSYELARFSSSRCTTCIVLIITPRVPGACPVTTDLIIRSLLMGKQQRESGQE